MERVGFPEYRGLLRWHRALAAKKSGKVSEIEEGKGVCVHGIPMHALYATQVF